MAPATPESGTLAEIAQIAINVRDLGRAVACYRDALGMSLLFQTPTMAFFQCGGVRLMLSLPEQPEFDHPASILYFRVDDIDAAHRELTERGIAFRAAPHCVHRSAGTALWMAFFGDTEGNTLALMCERREA